MENIIIFDDDLRDQLLPLSYTRPVCELRVGILTIREKWELWLKGKASFITQDYLTPKFPIQITDDNYVVNGSVLPSERLCRLITQLENNEALLQNGELIAARLNESQFEHLMNNEDIEELEGFDVEDTPFIKINKPWDIFSNNGEAIKSDFDLITHGRVSMPISSTNRVLGADKIFIEEGAVVEFATLNATNGPIYIGKNAEIMEGCMVRGPLAMCENSVLKMGAKIYGATTLGPYCKVGGEVNNSVFTGYSNKGHDGFLGNSVIGEWCNIGADTNNSNLKNNYAEVKLWDYSTEKFEPTGLQFCGLIMGDHSKCAINTMFNTGTIIGVAANIFGAGFPRNFIPSFSWGGKSGFTTFKPNKVMEMAEKMMTRRKIELSAADNAIIQQIYDDTVKYRSWESMGQRQETP